MSVDTTIIYTLLYISLYFEVFLLLSFLAHKRSGATHHNLEAMPSANMPTATIIVPCYNEARTITATLRSLLALDYPTDKLTITVVDDGSRDNTRTLAESVAQEDARVTVLHKENGGKASAMNLALQHCNTELIGCLDADSFVQPNALKLIAQQFALHPDAVAVTPAIMVHEPTTILQLIQRAEYMIGVFLRRAFGMLNAIVVTPGPFSIFRTAAVRDVNGWKHAHGTEDFEMGLRLQSLHKRILNEPLAQVLTVSPHTLYKLYRQRLRWVYGFLMNTWDYRHMVGNYRYGNVGLFVLPTALISVFGAIYLFLKSLWTLGGVAAGKVIELFTVGFHFGIPRVDLFYFETSALLFIVMALVGLILIILHNASRMSNVRVHMHDTVLYLTLYGFIAPLWLTAAAVRATVGKEASWRATLSQ